MPPASRRRTPLPAAHLGAPRPSPSTPFLAPAVARAGRRAAGFAGDAGADIGEVVVTTARIPEGDEDAWTAAWKATADRIAERGEVSLEVGDPVSAREAFFRASSYYRSAEFHRREDALNDPQVLELSQLSKEGLVKAGALLDGPSREVAIFYEGLEIPGYLFLVDDSGEPRPTVVYTNGFDSTREEGYFVIGAAAPRRGYNFLAYAARVRAG